MSDDLKIIKKKYGEEMMHLCRELFSSLLENHGVLSNLILSKFAPNKFLYKDIIDNNNIYEFKNYILGFIDEKECHYSYINKTPKELLEEAGYLLYECKTEEDIQSFRKYYDPLEELCTFKGGRLEDCYVFFAVKKNVDEIRRENFFIPNRQDEYGTSVISIQFSRGEINTLSIKNRYNHTVTNPDATFSNNLDNIIPGLTNSFEREYGFCLWHQYCDFELPGYVQLENGLYYKYNQEINNIYYCPNNVIIDNGRIIDDYLDQGRYIVMDYFILDLKNKRFFLYDNSIQDSFIDCFDKIDKINILKLKENDNRVLEVSSFNHSMAVIEISFNNEIIGYCNDSLKIIGNNFLLFNEGLKKLELVNLIKIEDNFLSKNNALEVFYLPNLVEVGDWFLFTHNKMKSLILPSLTKIGDYFLFNNQSIECVELPNVIQIGEGFLHENDCLNYLYLPNLVEVGDWFLYENNSLKYLELSNLVKAGDLFLYNNNCLEYLGVDSLNKVGSYFLFYNNSLKSLNLPRLVEVGDWFLSRNCNLKNFYLSNLCNADFCFSHDVKKLRKTRELK